MKKLLCRLSHEPMTNLLNVLSEKVEWGVGHPNLFRVTTEKAGEQGDSVVPWCLRTQAGFGSGTDPGNSPSKIDLSRPPAPKAPGCTAALPIQNLTTQVLTDELDADKMQRGLCNGSYLRGYGWCFKQIEGGWEINDKH